jgi:hypothetical protein
MGELAREALPAMPLTVFGAALGEYLPYLAGCNRSFWARQFNNSAT